MKIKSSSNSASITIAVIAVLTIWSELSSGFKTLLANLTGHHWTTKGVISLILFFALYFILPQDNKSLDLEKETKKVLWVTIISGFAIFFFYVLHFLKVF